MQTHYSKAKPLVATRTLPMHPDRQLALLRAGKFHLHKTDKPTSVLLANARVSFVGHVALPTPAAPLPATLSSQHVHPSMIPVANDALYQALLHGQ